jgi:hypothetical protein
MARVAQPEPAVEPPTQPGRLGTQLLGLGHVPKRFDQGREALVGRVDVALYLWKGDGAFTGRPVGVNDRLIRVLPALVSQPVL